MREGKFPLRTVLQNFINNVESLEASKNTNEDKYEREFQELKKLTESLKNHHDFVCHEGEKECNRRKNRYKDILPYDKTRVVLQSYPGIPGSDYVNANYIRGASGSKAYIASQGPLSNTVPDFWRMVVECDVQVIVMASNETEGGKHKCECYWVDGEGEEKQFGNVLVSFVKSRQVCPDFLVRTLKIQYTSEKNKTEERTICQFHYMLWPDHGVPDTVRPLLDMVRLVRDCQASETLPVLVHCSAGCGRTGTICAIDYVWGLLRTGKLTDNLYLLGLVSEMRVQRVAMVQTKEQYTLLHRAVKELFKERLSLIDSHPYENISTDGNPIFLKALKNKESDYEELFVSQEKQDQSTKTSTPSLTPTSASTPSGSLTRKATEPNVEESTQNKDNLRRSVSTSSLDVYQVSHLSGKLKHLTPFDAAVSDFSVEKQIVQSMLSLESDIQRLKMMAAKIPDKLNASFKRPPSHHSKMEKDAENFAQKMEYKEKEKEKRSSGVFSACLPGSSLSTNLTPLDICVHPHKLLATPVNTQNLMLGGVVQLQNPPLPPPRSRTPSPIISIRKVVENRKTKLQQVHNQQPVQFGGSQTAHQEHVLDCPKVNQKEGELSRKASIKKLKELFDRPSSHTIICPNGSKLCRSASSVTSRPSLSVPNDMTMSLKVKRKGSIGWDEAFPPFNKSSKEDNAKLQICPPPPPLNDLPSSPNFVAFAGKPPSSPGVIRKFIKQTCEKDTKVENKSFLLRLDDRPALPLKKSKSFRWTRPQTTASSAKPISRSPDSTRKCFDTYFSLDRAKFDQISNSMDSYKPESKMPLKRLATDVPTPHEGLKLSVYEFSQDKNSASSAYNSSEESLLSKGDTKPLIPPKKYIGDKHKTSKIFTPQVQSHSFTGCKDPQILLTKSEKPVVSAPLFTSDSSYENPAFWESCTENFFADAPNQEQLHDKHKIRDKSEIYSEEAVSGNILENKSIPIDLMSENKDYVNARVFKTNLDASSSPKYVYVPLPSKRAIRDKERHDYANCNVSNKDLERDRGDNFTFSEYVLNNDSRNLCSAQNIEKVKLTKAKSSSSSSKAIEPISSSHFFSDYEPVDFGESTMTNIDEVFETVNVELLEYEERQRKINGKLSKKGYYLNRDLDSIAIQVYKDCQEYLLHGNNHSPVPSLMPKPNEKEDTFSINENGLQIERATEVRVQPSDDDALADLEEVRSKVAVPPQGLRSRERRHSYRQAVSPTSPSYPKVLGSPKKNIHKYEKIWFESSKEGPMNDAFPILKESIVVSSEGTASKTDYSANLNRPMNISGKEAIFKDKLQELQSFVSPFEMKKLPDLSEEELSSKDSGSTSSLFSRSAQSSRSSERTEPIYVNTQMVHLPASSVRRSSKSETSLLTGRHSNPLLTGASPYGTLATTTSYPYKPKLNLPPHHNEADSPFLGYQPSHTATLPARSTVSPPSTKGITPSRAINNNSIITSSDSKEAILRKKRTEQPSSDSQCNTIPAFNSQFPTHQHNINKHARKPFKTYSKGAPNVSDMSSDLPRKKPLITRDDCSINNDKLKFHQPNLSMIDNIPANYLGKYNTSLCPMAPPRIKRNTYAGYQHLPQKESTPISLQSSLFCSDERSENDTSSTNKDRIKDIAASSFERAVPYSQGNSSNFQSKNISLNPSVFYHRPPPPKPVRFHSDHPKHVPNNFEITNPSLMNIGNLYANNNKPSNKAEKGINSKSGRKNHPNRRSVELDLGNNYKAEQGQLQHKSTEQLNRRSIDQDLSNRKLQENCKLEMDVTGVPSASSNGIQLPYPNGIMEIKTESVSSSKEEIFGENSSTDTSMEEDGIFHKITAPNFLKKFRNPQPKYLSDGNKRPVSPKSSFIPSKEDSCVLESEEKLRGVISPPVSPRPLTKAFGRLKLGSKSVAANFKSYLSLKGNSDDPSGGSDRQNSLQKSASTGPAITVFSQVVEECKFPNSIPKKPIGPRELPENFRSYANNPTNSVVANRPRQQYL